MGKKEPARGAARPSSSSSEEKNRELGADIKARQTIRRDADAIVLRLVDRRSIVSSRSAHSILLSRSPEYSYLVISGEHPSKVARSLARTGSFIVIRNLPPGRDTRGSHARVSLRVCVRAWGRAQKKCANDIRLPIDRSLDFPSPACRPRA